MKHNFPNTQGSIKQINFSNRPSCNKSVWEPNGMNILTITPQNDKGTSNKLLPKRLFAIAPNELVHAMES